MKYLLILMPIILISCQTHNKNQATTNDNIYFHQLKQRTPQNNQTLTNGGKGSFSESNKKVTNQKLLTGGQLVEYKGKQLDGT